MKRSFMNQYQHVAVVGASHRMSMIDMAHRRLAEAALISPRKEDMEQVFDRVYREIPKPTYKLIPRKRTGATSFKSLMRYGDLHKPITQSICEGENTMKYRKKPVVIEAWKYDGTVQNAPDWLNCDHVENHYPTTADASKGDKPFMTIATLEGVMTADFGDYIIKGVQGELYPCKPDIFNATYEQVE